MTKLFLTRPAMMGALAALALSPVTAKTPAPRPAGHAANEHMLHAALADANRPQADKDRDAARHPAELLALMDLKPGAKVADFIMGGGYWTRILSNAVGPTGKVYAYQPAEFIQYRAAYAAEQDAAVAGRANVVADRQALAQFSVPPASVDAIITVQNWHDLHLKISPPGFAGGMAKKLYAALKPGGVLLVVDHVGVNPTPFAVADSLHRGDADATKAEIESAGFKLAASSPLYANPADPHTALVFDPAIRGKTDQFVYKFVKPKG